MVLFLENIDILSFVKYIWDYTFCPFEKMGYRSFFLFLICPGYKSFVKYICGEYFLPVYILLIYVIFSAF